MHTTDEVLDVTDGFDLAAARDALRRLCDAGAGAICVAEAFAPDDPGNERAVAELAAELDLPVCTSSELTGLYGLELRTVTATLNAAITPSRCERRTSSSTACSTPGSAARSW